MEEIFNTTTKIFNKHLNSLSYNKIPSNLYTPIEYTLNLNGKKIRPTLSLCIYQLLGGEINSNILNVSTAIELFHNFTLIHDDIIDNSDYRRGKESVHKKFGVNSAILSGDALMILAYKQLDKIEDKFLPKTFKIFNEIALGICEGQQLDINYETNNNVSLEEYTNMIRLKTAILLGLSFQISGIIAEININEEKLLFEIGENLGIAYQIQDDYLDLYGDFEKFGKPIGNDVLLNKKTFLSISAYNNANENQKNILNQLQNNNDNQDKIIKTKDIFNQLEIPKLTKNIINVYYEKILNDIKQINSINNKNKIIFSKIIQQFIYRTT